MTTKRNVLKGMVVLGSLVGALTAQATPTLITTLDLSQFPSFGDSQVQSGIQNAITAWNAANDPDLPTTGIGSTPDVKLNQGDVVSGFPTFGGDTLAIELPAGTYNYVFLHWGGPNVDAFYKNPELYYIGGETGTVNFTAPIYTEQIPAEYFTSGPKAGQLKKAASEVNHQYGLSFYSFYSEIPVVPPPPGNPPPTSLPDSGASLALLSVGVLGLAGLQRRR